jgi:hypothetical protein
MRIRHPAAMTLLAWYILFPPLVTRSGVVYMEPNVAARLTEWRPMQIEDGTVLDSERTCENYRSAMASAVGNSLPDAPPDLGKMPLNKSESAEKWVYAAEILNSRCIASDDPRLKAK